MRVVKENKQNAVVKKKIAIKVPKVLLCLKKKVLRIMCS